MSTPVTPASRPVAELSDRDKMRLLPWAYAHGALNSVYSALTFFGPVFILFLDALDLPKTRIGFLLSLLPFCGLVAPFIAPTVARIGVKRVFIACWGMRKVVTALLLLLPWCVERYGTGAAFGLVAGVMAVFALLRAVAETAWYPWFQEVVPRAYRGRYSGINSSLTMLASCIGLAGSSWVLANVEGLRRFTVLVAVGVAAGVLCVLLALPIPGGAPRAERSGPLPANLRRALSDARFRRYLLYTAVAITAVQAMLMAFMPLFMKEQVGLSERQIILLQIASYVAGLLSSHAWGRAADRRGSRSVVGAGLAALLLAPAAWALMPRAAAWSFPVALGITAWAGAALAGLWIGDQRLLYVDVVPPARRTEYMALYYAWIGLVGGCCPLLAGWLLDRLQGVSGHWGMLTVDPYLPLFAGGAVLLATAQVLLRRIPGLQERAAAAGEQPA